jgi:hypothetical protein
MAPRRQPAPMLAETQIQPPLILHFQVQFVNPNLPVQCPSFKVAPGWTVTLIPVNGNAVNVHPCFFSDSPDILIAGGGRTLPAGGDVAANYPTTDTGKIWALGQNLDGLLIEVSAPGIG